MNKYTKRLLFCIGLTVLCISISITGPDDYQMASTIGIVVFWISGLVFFFLRGLVWYKDDLAERAIAEAERREENEE